MNTVGSVKIKHVLRLSIDGMPAVYFYNCAHGIAGANGGSPYCPNMAALASGGTPKSTGLYYDVAYDRSLDAPEKTTGTGPAAGPCTPYGVPTGTTTDNDPGIDIDDTKLNGGAPGAALTGRRNRLDRPEEAGTRSAENQMQGRRTPASWRSYRQSSA